MARRRPWPKTRRCSMSTRTAAIVVAATVVALCLGSAAAAAAVGADPSSSSTPVPPSFFRQLAQEGEAVSASSLASPVLDGLLSGDRRLDVLESCLPSERHLAAAPLLQRGQDLVEDNGGTVLALAGPDYCVLAADTRLSSDYRIRTRNVTRLFEVSPLTFMGMAGSWADVTALRREMALELGRFAARHGRPMGTKALGTFLSNRLYLHRLQPMYALNLVAGLDDQGRGAVYSYDVVGSYNRVTAACCGRGQELMQPVLDQFASEAPAAGNVRGVPAPLSCEEAVRVVKEAFLSGAEREISIGDEVEVVVIRRGTAPTVERLALPRH